MFKKFLRYLLLSLVASTWLSTRVVEDFFWYGYEVMLYLVGDLLSLLDGFLLLFLLLEESREVLCLFLNAFMLFNGIS